MDEETTDIESLQEDIKRVQNSLSQSLKMMKSLQLKLEDCIEVLQYISGCSIYCGQMTEEIATGMCYRAKMLLEQIGVKDEK